MSITDIVKSKLDLDKSGLSIDNKDGYYTVRSEGPHNILGSLYDAATTLDNDHNNYKKKALAGAVGTLGSGALLAYLQGRSMHDFKAGPNPDKLSLALLTAQLLGGYYAARNPDRPVRALLGGSVLAGATLADMKRVPDNLPPLKNPILSGLATAGIGSSIAYTVNNLQLADDQAQLEAIIADPKLTEAQRVEKINRIREGKDLLTRYPIIRVAPYSEKLRAQYNKVHTPSTDVRGATDFVRMKVR